MTNVLTLMICLLGVASVFADDIKIGVVHTEKILRESLFALQSQKRLDQEFIPRDEEIKQMAAEARVLRNDKI